MQHANRDPMKFDVLNAFAVYGREQKLSLLSSGASEGFVAQVRESVKQSLDNNILMYGVRTENLFEAMIANFGAFQAFKKEDCGEAYSPDVSLLVPDFRVVLRDGSQMLIEVKNFHQGDRPQKPFTLSSQYLLGLSHYSEVMGCELKIAIYWSNWNAWTLVPPSAFQRRRKNMVVSLEDAMMANELGSIGDLMVGIKFPLCLRLLADKEKERTVDNDNLARFTITEVEFYCGDQQITDPAERDMAWFFMLYGDWSPEGPVALISQGHIDAVDYRFIPPEDHHQGFEVIGHLSSMFSQFYRHRTGDQEGIGRLQIDNTRPEPFVRLIADGYGYESDTFPMWRFTLRPSSDI